MKNKKTQTKIKQTRANQKKSIQKLPLKLTQDIVFKSFFSRNKQVLMSLLKNFLPIPDQISDVEILNLEQTENKKNQKNNTNKTLPSSTTFQNLLKSKPLELKQSSLIPEKLTKKQVVLDLRVKLQTGENINVEMQAVSQKSLLKRILFYWAKLYCQDLEKGEAYDKINPAYSLIFTCFPVLDKKIKDFVSSFSVRRDKKPYELFNKDLKIVIVEMSKLTKAYDELLDLKEKWCYLLKESGDISKEEYRYLSKDEEIRMALQHLKRLSKDEELYQKALTEQINLVAHNLDRAGLLKEGMQKGMAQGKLTKQKEIALNMLNKNLEISLISEVTGLSKNEILKLRK